MVLGINLDLLVGELSAKDRRGYGAAQIDVYYKGRRTKFSPKSGVFEPQFHTQHIDITAEGTKENLEGIAGDFGLALEQKGFAVLYWDPKFASLAGIVRDDLSFVNRQYSGDRPENKSAGTETFSQRVDALFFPAMEPSLYAATHSSLTEDNLKRTQLRRIFVREIPMKKEVENIGIVSRAYLKIADYGIFGIVVEVTKDRPVSSSIPSASEEAFATDSLSMPTKVNKGGRLYVPASVMKFVGLRNQAYVIGCQDRVVICTQDPRPRALEYERRLANAGVPAAAN